MTLTTLDTSTIEHLDFEPEQACEAKGCEQVPVTHFAESIQCGCAKFLCSECAARIRKLIETGVTVPIGTCLHCRATLFGQPRDCVRLVPL